MALTDEEYARFTVGQERRYPDVTQEVLDLTDYSDMSETEFEFI